MVANRCVPMRRQGRARRGHPLTPAGLFPPPPPDHSSLLPTPPLSAQTVPSATRPQHRAAATAMVFEGESSDDQSSLPDMPSSNSSTDGIYEVPVSMEDPDYHGLELDIMVFYDKHDRSSKRHVAIEGRDTGRRFLACGEPNALLKLWAMFEDAKNARVTNNLESSLTIHHLTEENNTLDANYDKSELVADMKGRMAKKDADHKHLNDKYQLMVNLTRSDATVIHNLKFKNTKEKEVHSEDMEKLELKNAKLTKFEEKLTQEKLELKFQIATLLKGKEVQSEERG
ncbi:hypothetical protein D1007_49780 [Hordeum vulgare]|nr:hypothetical protein D1007_49780 [Hordeum vulgare]